MKILIVHNFYRQPGGEDVVAKQEAALLRSKGHEVITYERSNAEADGFGIAAKVALPFRVLRARDAVHQLRRLIRAERPDVAHFHNTFMMISPAAYAACRREGIPVVQTLHNYRLMCPAVTFFRDGRPCEDCLGRLPWPGVVHACYRNSRAQTAMVGLMVETHRAMGTWKNNVDAYIALTEFARGKFIEGGLPPEKIAVKPNFVYPDPGTGAGSEPTAVFIGRFTTEKGILALLEAWKGQNARLRLFGDGPLMPQAKSLASQVGNIEFMGQRPRAEVLESLKTSGFLVLPSEWYEGFPMTIVEAFACGKPVIAARLGSMAEIIEHGKTGFHFDAGDASSLSLAVRNLIEAPGECTRMGANARAEFEAKYTAERNYESLMKIYETAKKKAAFPA